MERYEQMKSATISAPNSSTASMNPWSSTPLGRDQIRAIAAIQIGYLRKRLQDRDLANPVVEGEPKGVTSL